MEAVPGTDETTVQFDPGEFPRTAEPPRHAPAATVQFDPGESPRTAEPTRHAP